MSEFAFKRQDMTLESTFLLRVGSSFVTGPGLPMNAGSILKACQYIFECLEKDDIEFTNGFLLRLEEFCRVESTPQKWM